MVQIGAVPLHRRMDTLVVAFAAPAEIAGVGAGANGLETSVDQTVFDRIGVVVLDLAGIAAGRGVGKVGLAGVGVADAAAGAAAAVAALGGAGDLVAGEAGLEGMACRRRAMNQSRYYRPDESCLG